MSVALTATIDPPEILSACKFKTINLNRSTPKNSTDSSEHDKR